jgi:hypothetical protein
VQRLHGARGDAAQFRLIDPARVMLER